MTGRGISFVNPEASRQPSWEMNQAVIVEGGRLLFTSLILGTDLDRSVKKDDVAHQAERAFQNLSLVLEAANSSMDQVIRLTVYLAAGFAEYRTRLKQIRDRYVFADYPASVMVRVDGFANPDALIALEAIARLDH